jgi:hypothetical protein
MGIESAKKLIRNTFQNSFNKIDFIYFIKNLLNQYDESKIFHLHGCYIPDSFKDYIKSYERIGTYTDPEGKKIDILIVHLKREITIDRARTAQRNFIARYLKERDEKDAGLIAFVSPQEEDWRFSFVKMEYKFEKTSKGDVKVKEKFTPARRYSFLVGKNESSHTAQSCFVDILINDTYNLKLNEVEEAFNIEKVTKEFYEKYRNLFFQVKDALDDIVKKDEEIRKEFQQKGVNIVDFSKKLLGQIVFLYFLQKKGWFGVPRGKDWGEGDKKFLRNLFDIAKKENRNYFNKFLEPLFYEALRLERPKDYYAQFNCRIPFLNGGLFDPLNDYDWQDTDIDIPNEIFSNSHNTKEGDTGDGILDVFDRYNFTVKEDEPLEKEVAIDPEMLGKVFENLLEVKDRKSKGTYYTPREIVHYMCQQSLINYLYTEVNSKQKSRTKEEKIQMKLLGKPDPIQQSLIIEEDSNIISKEDFEKLIKYGDTTIENDNHVATKGEETKSYSFKLPENIRKNAEIIDKALKNIRVCDPAIGSGAFPVGMMNEIIRARNVLTPYMLSRRDYLAQPPKQSYFSAEILNGSEESRTIYKFKRHAIQNCIYGVDIDQGAIEIAKLRLWLSLIVDEDDIKKIKPLPNLDYKIVCGNSLLGVEKNLFNANLFSKLEKLKPLYFNETNPTKKQEYKKQIEELISQITNGHKEFDFEVYFSEVFHKKGGFDVAIANPPYVGQKGNKKLFQIFKRHLNWTNFYERKQDLYYYFIAQGIKILNNKAVLSYITPPYFTTAAAGKNLRKYIIENSNIYKILNLSEDIKVFESASINNLVLFLNKSNKDKKIIIEEPQKNTDVFSMKLTKYKSKFSTKELNSNEWYLFKDSKTFEIPLKNTLPLGIISTISPGIQTGCDKISKAHIASYNLKNLKKGEGIFVLTEKEKNRLDLSTKELDYVKPFYKNSDIFKWGHSVKNNSWIVVTNRIQNIDRYSKLKKHLIRYKPILDNRYRNFALQNADKDGKWWFLYGYRPNTNFDNEKIILPYRSVENTFAYSNKPFYSSIDVFYINIIQNTYDVKFVNSILCSRLINYWLKKNCKKKGRVLELYQKPLSLIPIKITSRERQNPFVKLVDKILTFTKNEDYLHNPQKQTKVNALEQEIDQLVYKLYNLTPKEIEIVEGFKNK